MLYESTHTYTPTLTHTRTHTPAVIREFLFDIAHDDTRKRLIFKCMCIYIYMSEKYINIYCVYLPTSEQ